MTSHRSIGTLPEPQFFTIGGFAFAIALMALPIIALLDGLAKFSRLVLWSIILLALGVIFLPITIGMAFFGSLIVYEWVYQPLQNLPAIIFPSLFLISLGLYGISQLLERTFSLRLIQVVSVCVVWFAAFYIWGQTAIFEDNFYDEGLEIGGRIYHSIITNAYSDNPRILFLYECQFSYCFRTEIYHSSAFDYYPDEPKLGYHEAAGFNADSDPARTLIGRSRSAISTACISGTSRSWPCSRSAAADRGSRPPWSASSPSRRNTSPGPKRRRGSCGCAIKAERIAAAGVDELRVLRFDAGRATVAAEEFIGRVLVDALGARQVVIGEGFRFGRQRRGDAELLRRAGDAEGFSVTEVAPRLAGGRPVSSTRVREALAAGRLEEAKSRSSISWK